MAAVTEIDLAYAREDFAEKMKATRPVVREEGEVDCELFKYALMVPICMYVCIL